MKRSRKILLAVLLATVVLAGSISGVALAADGDDEDGPATEFGNFMDRVIELYQEKTGATIDKDKLHESLNESMEELGDRPRIQVRQRVLDDLTEEQREALDEWLESRPEFPTEEFEEWMESRPDFPTEEFEEWMESRPDDIPFGPGPRGGFGHGGFNGHGRFGGGFERFGCPGFSGDTE